MIIFALLELFLISCVVYLSWKHLIKPAIQGRSGNIANETKLEDAIRDKKQSEYEKDLLDKTK